jgi:hypothetical protein
MPVLTPQISTASAAPTVLPPSEEKLDVAKFRETKEGQDLVAFFTGEFTSAKRAQQQKRMQWFQNMSMFFGNQYAEQVRSTSPGNTFQDRLVTPKAPYYKRRKTVNRTRSFFRTELSKFLASIPQAISVPATSEDEDLRAALAGEQAWESISETRKLRQHFTRAAWWMVMTGNGFVKTWWDPSVCVDKDLNQYGDIRFGAITPFHLFVPDLREQDIEDQPFVINAYTKSVQWVKAFFGEELGGKDIQPTVSSANSILEEGYLNLQAAGRPANSVIVYECWCKPGATKHLPEGGVVVIVDDFLVGLYREGLPYDHNMYPYTKFEHIQTGQFYADSPLVDTNQLQREYNQIRSEISEAGYRMARPQLLAVKGSIVPGKLTNEPGLLVEYKAGSQPPTPIPLTPLPEYYVSQQDRVLADWEDITGQHQVSKGTAPTGITAGTAINYLQEKDNDFLLPQYQSVEDGYEKIAQQTLGIFVQYVDMPRKLKTVGTDQAFDLLKLSGADIKNGMDIRIQKGSAVGESQAAKQAKIMDMFSAGLITDPNQALKLLEMGGTDKILDLMNVAERKAQRENMKMRTLSPIDIEMSQMKWDQEQQMKQMMASLAPQPPVGPPAGPTGAPPDPNAPPAAPAPAMGGAETPMDDPTGVAPGADDPGGVEPAPVDQTGGQDPTQAPIGGPEDTMKVPLVPVADFDVHPVHIETHNKYRMSQGYEMLDPAIQAEFELHVKWHEAMVAKAAFKVMMQQMAASTGDPSMGGDPNAAPPSGSPADTLAPNGAAPDMAPQTGGDPNA